MEGWEDPRELNELMESPSADNVRVSPQPSRVLDQPWSQQTLRLASKVKTDREQQLKPYEDQIILENGDILNNHDGYLFPDGHDFDKVGTKG